jgi:hypothetical protein
MRRFISTLSGIVLGLGCVVGTGNAANFSDSSIGISIDLDDELVEQSQWRGYRVFSTADNTASVLIKPVFGVRLYDLRQDLKGEGGGFDDVDAIDLVVTGNERSAQASQGSSVMVPVMGRIGEYKIRGVFGGFFGFNDANFVVIAAARPDYWNDWKQRIKLMFDSIRFIEIDYSEMMTDWYTRVVGKSLVPLNPVARGPLVPKPINLCSNGTVANEKPAKPEPATPKQQQVWNGVAWVTVPVAPMPRPPARWSINPILGKPTLVIRQGPLPQEFVLEMEGDQLLVNGKPYNITDSTLCQ